MDELEMDSPNYSERREALGVIVEVGAQLEATVGLLVATLLGEKPVGRAVTARLSMSQTIRLAKELAALRLEPERQEKLARSLSKAAGAAQDRNLMIHSLWGASKNPGEPWTHTRLEVAPVGLHEVIGAEAPLDYTSRDVTIEELQGIAQRLSEADQEIRDTVELEGIHLLAGPPPPSDR